MTIPSPAVSTVPYCGACGWKPFAPRAGITDLNDDLLCDACGADLLAYGWNPGLVPPAGASILGDTPLAGDVSVTFTANVDADTTDLRWNLNGGVWSAPVLGVTSVYVLTQVVTGAVSTDVVGVQLRSVDGGVDGPWGQEHKVTIA